MKNFNNIIKKYFGSSRFISKSLAILAGGLAGLAIANWVGLIIGIAIGYFFEALLAKAIKKIILSK